MKQTSLVDFFFVSKSGNLLKSEMDLIRWVLPISPTIVASCRRVGENSTFLQKFEWM